LSKEVVDLTTQYSLFDELQDFHMDEFQVIGAHSKYADPLMESLLLKMHPIVEKNTGLSLYPTYSFYRVYRPGHELKPHKDRPSCEITATLSLNYDYMGKDYDWKIFIESRGYSMDPGDLIIFRGPKLKHWRERLDAPEGSWHVQAFLHFVDANGKFANYKYDEREMIGSLKTNGGNNG
jgi:hypothetical protein